MGLGGSGGDLLPGLREWDPGRPLLGKRRNTKIVTPISGTLLLSIIYFGDAVSPSLWISVFLFLWITCLHLSMAVSFMIFHPSLFLSPCSPSLWSLILRGQEDTPLGASEL